MDKETPKMGRLVLVENKEKHHLANDTYFSVKVELPSGEETYLLFTDKEIEQAQYRADRNPEDIAQVSFLRDLFD